MAATDIPTGDHRDLLDIIDSLRSEGFSHYVNLPEIIVCGDQSAGKSSVLEAISGMAFPTKDGLCTRFATELILRRGPETSTKVRIMPGEERHGEAKEYLESWQPRASIDDGGLEAVTKEAKDAMDRSGVMEFHDDILRIERTGPQQPHLTMVDLPGLFKTGNSEQSEDDASTVRDMVERYMRQPRSIILAVVSAKNEFVLQEVTSMARAADPKGRRTMGLITKPDKLDVGSDSENKWARIAKNAEVVLHHGWHVLRNRNFEERGCSSAQRDANEAEFFKSGIWASVDPAHCGVGTLKSRLSSILKLQIVDQLPDLVRDAEDRVKDCTEKLERLGPARGTEVQQKSYLLGVSEQYTSLMTHAVDGTWSGSFFGHRNKTEEYPRRLRAQVQNRLLDFGREMRLNGQSQLIYDSESELEVDGEVSMSRPTPRSEYVEDVASRLKWSRGRELPGLFNPLIVGDLFAKQCGPWREITENLVEAILTAVNETAKQVVGHVVASDVAEEVLSHIRDGIESLKHGLDVKVDELLVSAMQCPVTCNPQLTENVQKAQQARHKRAIKALVCKTFNLRGLTNEDAVLSTKPLMFVDLLTEASEPDMERFGSSMAVDYMEAYYKVAIDRFIDDVSVLAIEDCLIGKLPELLRPRDVAEFSLEDISRLAGEAEATAATRELLEQKRKTIKAGLQRLKRFNISRVLTRAANLNVSETEDPQDTPDKSSVSLGEASSASSTGERSPVTEFSGGPAAQVNSHDDYDEPFATPATNEELPGDLAQTEPDDPWSYSSTFSKKKGKRY